MKKIQISQEAKEIMRVIKLKNRILKGRDLKELYRNDWLAAAKVKEIDNYLKDLGYVDDEDL